MVRILRQINRVSFAWLTFCGLALTAYGCSGDSAEPACGEGELCPLCGEMDEPEDLRVDLLIDEGVHEETMEWWYWTGHMQAKDGRWFGFQLSFFLSALGDSWAHIVHHAITDVSAGSFQHSSDIGYERPEETFGEYDLSLPPFSAEGGALGDVLHAEMGDYVLDLDLTSRKAPVYQHGNGYHEYDFGGYTYYYTRSHLALSGTLKIGAEELEVSGMAWFDHQWGDLQAVIQKGYDWFALQLDDGSEIMLARIRDPNGGVIDVLGTITDSDCNSRELRAEEISITATGEWLSPHTGISYPSGWDIEVDDSHFVITPVLDDQELYDAIPLLPYWEGAATISGSVSGRAYVELTGYDE